MTSKIIDHLQAMCDVPTDITIASIEALKDAQIVVFTFDGEEQMAIYYPADDVLFTPSDWQSGRPCDLGDIERYDWVSSAGDSAIIVDGLPRAFGAIRDEARKNFGSEIRSLREAKGLSQEELAQKSGIKRANISRIEGGRYGVTLDTITRLSAALGEELIALRQ